MPKISVVLPTYNGSKYLAESIKSIINQTFTDWELIIINDCSTDNTLEIANSFAEKDSRIKVFTNPENLKLPNSLNEGFKRATGEYFTWTSDDNLYFPTALETMINELSDDIVLVYADCNEINENGECIGLGLLPPPYRIVLGNNIGACFLYTRNVYEKIGNYDADLFLAEDYDYWVRIYNEGNFKHIEKVLYSCRRHSKSLTATKSELIQKQTVKLFEKHFYFLYSEAKKNGLGVSFLKNVYFMSSGMQHKTISNKVKEVSKVTWVYCKMISVMRFLYFIFYSLYRKFKSYFVH